MRELSNFFLTNFFQNKKERMIVLDKILMLIINFINFTWKDKENMILTQINMPENK